MANYHVTQKKGQQGWNVKKEGGQKASAIASTQKEAEKIAKQYSANSGGGEVRIHMPNAGPLETATQSVLEMTQGLQKTKSFRG